MGRTRRFERVAGDSETLRLARSVTIRRCLSKLDPDTLLPSGQ